MTLDNFCIAGIDLGVASGIAPLGRLFSNAEIYFNPFGFPVRTSLYFCKGLGSVGLSYKIMCLTAAYLFSHMRARTV